MISLRWSAITAIWPCDRLAIGMPLISAGLLRRCASAEDDAKQAAATATRSAARAGGGARRVMALSGRPGACAGRQGPLGDCAEGKADHRPQHGVHAERGGAEAPEQVG